MSLVSSLFTGVGGLKTFSRSLQVIGNNIANVSTIGFKSSRAEFADLISQGLLGGQGSIGLGVRLQSVTRSFSQGPFNNTDRLTDLGIDGDGFFELAPTGSTDRFYTRNGQFNIDANGFLVNAAGLRVQGERLVAFPNLSAGLGDIKLNGIDSPPKATSDGVTGRGVEINMNLDSRSDVIAGGFDSTSVQRAVETSNFSTTISVFDSVGNSHTVSVYFTKTQDAGAATNAKWSWNAIVDGSEVTGGTSGQIVTGASGEVEFDVNGNFVSQTQTPGENFDFLGSQQDQVVGFDFSSATQYANPSTVISQAQDGSAAGTLTSISIENNGTVTGFFSNGARVDFAKIRLATFSNPQGLREVGGSMFTQTLRSGTAALGDAGKGGRGAINPFMLELSNVDLANEFVGLVTNQRAYQANARVITSVDQLLSDTVNIIR